LAGAGVSAGLEEAASTVFDSDAVDFSSLWELPDRVWPDGER